MKVGTMNKEEQKNLILDWLAHIEQMASDRKTLNYYIMEYQDCLREIKVLARDSQEFIKLYW